MRAKFLYLTGVWLLGISVGVVRASYEKMFMVAAVTMFASFLGLRWPRPLVVAAGCLLILGALWGQHDGALSLRDSLSPTCKPDDILLGAVADRPVYKGIEARFVLVQDNGCRYVVYAEGSTKVFRGNEVKVSGRAQMLGDIKAEDTAFRNFVVSQNAQGVVRGKVSMVHSHLTWVQRLRQQLLGRLQRLFTEPEGALAAAMIFDERGGIPTDIQNEFRTTGTSHILAISGSNITLLAGLLLVVFLAVPVSPWWRTLAMVAIIWLYIVLIDRPVSAVRASVFWTAALLAFRLSSLMSLASIMVLAVVLMVSLRPTVMLDVGFQLSVAAVIGIWLALFLSKRLWREGQRVGLADLGLSSAGAFVATWPIVLYHFGSMAWIGLMANMVVVPLMSLLYGLMIGALLLDVVSHLAAQVAAYGVHILWLVTHAATRLFASVPYGYVDNLHLPALVIGLYYLGLVASCSAVLRWQRRSWREVWE